MRCVAKSEATFSRTPKSSCYTWRTSMGRGLLLQGAPNHCNKRPKFSQSSKYWGTRPLETLRQLSVINHPCLAPIYCQIHLMPTTLTLPSITSIIVSTTNILFNKPITSSTITPILEAVVQQRSFQLRWPPQTNSYPSCTNKRTIGVLIRRWSTPKSILSIRMRMGMVNREKTQHKVRKCNNTGSSEDSRL